MRQVFFKLFLFSFLILLAHAAYAESRNFTHFSVDLPEGWDGEEQKGFVSGNPEEYQLTLGRMDAGKDEFLAQISVYMLPNKTGASSREAASRLAEAQGGSTEPVQEGNFQVFNGEPRSNVIKGFATTMVNTTPQRMLIIIYQDPHNLGAAEITRGLRGMTPEAREMLGN